MKLLDKIETRLNHILGLDQDTLKSLAGLSGQVISLELLDTDFIIFILPSAAGVHLQNDCAEIANVKIRGTVSAMVAYLLKSKEKSTNFSGSIEVIGDVGLAQDFQAILLNIDLDWEEQLAQWFGDTAAHKFARLFRGAASFAINSADKLQQDVSEYLRFETELTPDITALNEFTNAVDILRNDAERLKLRINRIEQHKKVKAE